MIEIGIADQYMIIVAVTLFFSVLALTRDNVILNIILRMLSAGCWFFIASITPLLITGFMLTVTYLWLLIGLIMVILTVKATIDLFQQRKTAEEWLPRLDQ